MELRKNELTFYTLICRNEMFPLYYSDVLYVIMYSRELHKCPLYVHLFQFVQKK